MKRRHFCFFATNERAQRCKSEVSEVSRGKSGNGANPRPQGHETKDIDWLRAPPRITNGRSLLPRAGHRRPAPPLNAEMHTRLAGQAAKSTITELRKGHQYP